METRNSGKEGRRRTLAGLASCLFVCLFLSLPMNFGRCHQYLTPIGVTNRLSFVLCIHPGIITAVPLASFLDSSVCLEIIPDSLIPLLTEGPIP